MITPIIPDFNDFISLRGKGAYFDMRPYPKCIGERFLDESGALYAYVDIGGEVIAKYKGNEAYAFERSFKEHMKRLMDERNSKIKVWSLAAAFAVMGMLLK